MAIKFTPRYTNENEFIYDLASSSDLFDSNVFNDLISSNQAVDYAYAVIGAKDKDLGNFDWGSYNYLSSEDKFINILNDLYVDRNETAIDEETGKTYNVYERNKAYLDYKIEEAMTQETWDNMSGFEKVANTVGGVLGNTLNAVYSVFEGVLDATTMVVGGVVGTVTGAFWWDDNYEDAVKEAISWDITGTGAIQDSLNEFNRKYTYISRNDVARAINDIATGIGQMAPLALNIVAPGVGTAVYYTSMAGKTASTTIQANPDINYGNLLLYVGASTALEYGIEKISGKFFGGSTIDKLFGRNSSKVAGNIFGRLFKDFVSEGLEEVVSEIFDPMLYKWFVDQDAPLATIEEIAYAGLIGGLTGMIMSGGNVLTTRNRVLTSDGSLITLKDAKKAGLTDYTSLGKFKSNVLLDTLAYNNDLLRTDAVVDLQNKYRSLSMEDIQKQHKSEYDAALKANTQRDSKIVKSFQALTGTQTDSTAKLLNKYNNLTLEQIQTQHVDEYTKATTADSKRTQSVLAGMAGMNRIMTLIGEDGFKKSADLLSYHIETTAAAAKKFISSMNTQSSNKTFAAIENAYKKQLPGQSIQIRTDLTNAEQSFQGELSGKGMRVFFADFGAVPGAEIKKGFAIDENTIVLEKGLIEKYGVEAAWDKTIKVELVRMLQYDSGILTAKTLADLDFTYANLKPETNVNADKNIDEAYSDDSELSQIARVQAEAYAQVLLFDDVSLSNFYKTNTNIIRRVYDWMKNITNKDVKLAQNNKFNKLRYNKLLKAMRNYRKVMSEQVKNMEDVNSVAQFFSLNDVQIQELIDKYLPNPEFGHIALMKMGDTANTQRRTAATNELLKNRPLELQSDVFDYSRVFDTTYYTPEFRDLILSRNQEANFKDNLQDYLITSWGFLVNQGQQCLMESMDLNDVTTNDFKQAIANINKEYLISIKTAQDLFINDFAKRFITVNNKSSLSNITVEFVFTELEQPNVVEKTKTGLKINLSNNTDLTRMGINSLQNQILSQIAPMLNDINGFPNGVSSGFVYRAFDNLSREDLNQLKKLLLVDDSVETTALLDEEIDAYYENLKSQLATAIYRNTDGFYTNLSIKSETGIKDGGFKIDNNGKLIGYGVLKGFVLEVPSYTQMLQSYRIQELKTASETIAFTKTDSFKNYLKEQGLDYDNIGFSDEFLNAMELRNKDSFENIAYRMLSEDTVGNDVASNALIKYLKPDNKNIKTIQDVRQAINEMGIEYAYAYQMIADARNKKEPGKVDTEAKRSFNQLKKYFNENAAASNYWIKASEDTNFQNAIAEAKNLNLAKFLIDSDFDYSVNATKELIKKLKGRELFEIQNKRVSETVKDSEGKDASIFDRISDKQATPEEQLMQAISEDMSEKTQTRLLDAQDPATIKKVLKEALNVDNPEAFTIRDRLTKSENYEPIRKALNMSIEEFRAFLKTTDVKTKKAYTDSIKANLELAQARTDLTDAEKLLLEQDYKDLKTPRELTDFDNALQQIVKRSETTNEPSIIEIKSETISEKAPVKKAEIKIAKEKVTQKKEVVKETTSQENINTKTDSDLTKILNWKSDKLRVTEVQKVGEANIQTNAFITQQFITDNMNVLNRLSDETAQRWIKEFPEMILEGNQIQRNDMENNFFYTAMWIKQNFNDKFSAETVRMANEYLRAEATKSGRNLGLWSTIFEQATPIESLLKSYKEIYGREAPISDEIQKQYKEAIKTNDKKTQYELEEKIIKLVVEDLKVQGNEKITQSKFMNAVNNLHGFRYLAMLSNPSTWMRNIISNKTIGVANKMSNFILDRIQNSANYKEGQLKLRATGGISQATQNYSKEFLIDTKLLEHMASGGKYEMDSSNTMLSKAQKEVVYKSPILNKWNNFVYNVLEKADQKDVRKHLLNEFNNIMEANFSDLINEFNTLNNNQNRTSAENQQLKQVKSKLESASIVAVERAAWDAQKTYLKNDNAFSKWWSSLMNKNGFTKVTMGGILPFAKIAGNIVTTVFEYSPVNLGRGIYQMIRGKKDINGLLTNQNAFYTADAQLNISKGGVGVITMLIGVVLGALGIIDFDEDDNYGELVLRIPGTDIKLGLSSFAPGASSLLLGAALMSKDDRYSGFEAFFKTLSNQTALGTFDTLFAYGDSLSDWITKPYESYIKQFVPSVFRAVSKFIDPHQKKYSTNVFVRTLQSLAFTIPGVSYLLPNKVDPYTGESAVLSPGTEGLWNNLLTLINSMFSPISIGLSSKGDVEAEANRVGANTTGLGGTFSYNGDSVTLSASDKLKYESVRGQYITTQYGLVQTGKEKVTIERDGKRITTTYDKLTDDEKARVLKNIYSDASERAKIQYWLDKGNTYVVTDLETYRKLSAELNNPANLMYKTTYSGSKFIPKK